MKLEVRMSLWLVLILTLLLLPGGGSRLSREGMILNFNTLTKFLVLFVEGTVLPWVSDTVKGLLAPKVKEKPPLKLVSSPPNGEDDQVVS
jgi:hypothetical protein